MVNDSSSYRSVERLYLFGKYREILSEVDSANDNQPILVRAIAYLSLARLGQIREAEEGIESLIKILSPKESLPLRIFKATLLLMQGDFRATKILLETITEEDVLLLSLSLKLHYLNLRATVLRYSDDKDTSIATSYQAIELAEELDDPSWISYCYLVLGNTYNLFNDLIDALESFSIVDQIYRDQENKFGIAAVLGNTGEVLLKLGRYDEALELLLQSYQYNQRIESKKNAAHAAHLIGLLYFNTNRSELAKNYLAESFELEKESKSMYELVHSLRDLGLVYIFDDDRETGIAFLKSALQKAGDQKYQMIYSELLIYLVFFHSIEGEFNQVQYYLNRLDHIKTEDNQINKLIEGRISLATGIYYRYKGMNQENLLSYFQDYLLSERKSIRLTVISLTEIFVILVDKHQGLSEFVKIIQNYTTSFPLLLSTQRILLLEIFREIANAKKFYQAGDLKGYENSIETINHRIRNTELGQLLTFQSFLDEIVHNSIEEISVDSVLDETILNEVTNTSMDAITEIHDYYATVIHEINNLLSINMMSTDLAMQEANNTELNKYLSPILESAEEISSLTSNAIDRYNRETSDETQSRIILHKLISKKIRNHRVLVLKQNLEFNVNLEKSVIFGHVSIFERIFENLISNAIKYSLSNEIIQIRCINLDDTGKTQFSITNRTNKIELLEKDLIFEPSYRSSTNDASGTGMGLYFCKRAIESLNGELSVELKDDGTTITFYLIW